MDEFFNKVRQQFKAQLPFVIYCKPNAAEVIGVLQQSDSLNYVADFRETGFVFCSFDGSRNILLPNGISEIISAPFASDIKNVPDYNPDTAQNATAKASFIVLVGDAIKAINERKFDKVVLSRKETVKTLNFDVIETFVKLVNAYPMAFRYCFFHPKVGLWIGATPEQLIKINDKKFATTALAGTQQFNELQDVVWQEKEKQEQQFVTDFILENLDGVTTDIAFSNPYTYRAGNLVHIKTDIAGSLTSESSVGHLLKILHPTPAVCGLPKERAKEFIMQHEGYDRSFYSGFLGELNQNGKTDLFVNLRCMEIDGSHANLYVGCGITKDSNPEREFDETVRKSETMKRILN